MRKFVRAFTLIELLIVVAIIAILAAIAVPNFLEAQVRSKVSRVLSDMRNLKTGLESYYVDHNRYPETDLGPGPNPTVPLSYGRGTLRLTTPISYLSTVFISPFEEKKVGNPGNPKYSNLLNCYLYVSAKAPFNDTGAYAIPSTDVDGQGFDNNYKLDRAVYLFGQTSISPAINGLCTQGYYEIKSIGPDSKDDRGEPAPNHLNARLYDPTNGTLSAGDLVTYQDTSIKAEQRAP